MKISTFIAFFTLLLSYQSCFADIKHFSFDSIKKIENSYVNKKFVVAFWSIDCPPCMQELALLKQATDAHDDINLVLVNTDNLEFLDEANKTLSEFSLLKKDNWIFAEGNTEKLRYRIDKQWAGELPRSYFYDETHHRQSVSGAISEAFLQKWLHTTVKK